jgi:Tfp pilus assembly protein PilE
MKADRPFSLNHQKRSHPYSNKRRKIAGFSLVELAIAISALIILTSISLSLNQNEMRSSDSHALRNEIAAWLGEIAMAPENLNTTCTVTFQPGSQLLPGAAIASVQPSTCATQSTLRIPGNTRLTPFQVGTSQNSWVYTERGAISASGSAGASSTNTDIIIRVSVGGQPPLRCVRLSGIMGLIRFGVNSANGDAMGNTLCSDWRRT